MVKVTRSGITYSVDRKLYNQIIKFNVKELKRTDEYKIFLVCGSGGSGKSAFANQMAALLDENFSSENLGFTTAQFKSIILSKPNSALSFDEAYRGISGRNTLGKEQKELLQKFYEIRQLNQVIFLCTPSFFRLDEAIGVEISDGLFYIYKRKTKGSKKGAKKRVFYKYFNKKKKERLYYAAKKGKKNYGLVHTNFRGVVSTDTYVMPEQEYRKKKIESLYNVEIIGDSKGKDKKVTDFYKDREARLWGLVVNLSGSYSKASAQSKTVGIDVTKGTIQSKIAQNDEVFKVVGNQ